MRDRAVGFLRERIGKLDDGQFPVVAFDVDPRLLKFILVMTSYTNTTMVAETGGQPVLAPADADELAGTCRLLTDIAQGEAGLVFGPLDRTHQQWIATGRNAAPPTPTATRFIESTDNGPPTTKPMDSGLYTSTVLGDGRSMWRRYLDSVRGSSLHPLPWYTWNLPARDDAAVLEITSAREWADFVAAYGRRHEEMIYPYWPTVARDFDGIHLTLRAILAIQGFELATSRGPTAPTYWDVESTLWLRWCFTSPDLHEVTGLD